MDRFAKLVIGQIKYLEYILGYRFNIGQLCSAFFMLLVINSVSAQMDEFTNERKLITKSIYVWSDAFERFSVDYIYDYVVTNKYDEIELVVMEEDPHHDQKVDLMERLQVQNVNIALMYADNHILNLNYKKMKALLTDVYRKYPLNLVQTIHLDIEPHGRKDWEQNKNRLLSRYKILIQLTRELCDYFNKELSIDLPVWYDVKYVKRLMNKVELVRFMCYENINLKHLNKMLTPFLIQRKKVSISLDTGDFKTIADMEAFAKTCKEQFGVETINYHDFNRLIELSKR